MPDDTRELAEARVPDRVRAFLDAYWRTWPWYARDEDVKRAIESGIREAVAGGDLDDLRAWQMACRECSNGRGSLPDLFRATLEVQARERPRKPEPLALPASPEEELSTREMVREMIGALKERIAGKIDKPEFRRRVLDAERRGGVVHDES